MILHKFVPTSDSLHQYYVENYINFPTMENAQNNNIGTP
jgi:hypothetical protein